MCRASRNPLVPDPERGCLYLLPLPRWGPVGPGTCQLRGDAGPGARQLLPRQCGSWKWCPELTIRRCPYSQASRDPVPRLPGSLGPVSVRTQTRGLGVPGVQAPSRERPRRRGGSGGRRSAQDPPRELIGCGRAVIYIFPAPRRLCTNGSAGAAASLACAPLFWARSVCSTEVREGRALRVEPRLPRDWGTRPGTATAWHRHGLPLALPARLR